MKKILILLFFLQLLIISTAAASTKLQSLEVDILRENYNQAIADAVEIFPSLSSGELPRAQLLLGVAYAKTGKFEQARKYLNLALESGQNGVFLEEVELSLADTFYVEGNFEAAKSGYEKFLDEHKKTDYKNTAKFKLALTHYKMGNWAEAKSLFKTISASSALDARAAKDILDENQFYFTVQVGSFQDKKNANELLRQLKRAGFDCFIARTKCDDLTFYRVRVGKLNKRRDVDKLAEKLKAKGLPARIYP